jgi:hypothetical protein
LVASLAVLITSACSFLETIERPQTDANEPVPDYRRIIAESIVERRVVSGAVISATTASRADEWTYLFDDPGRLAPFEVSTEARRVQSAVGWAWLACIRAYNRGHPLYVAVFIQGNRVRERRAQVLSDQCGHQRYEPLPVTVPPPQEIPKR